jgi:hypothetical protein
MSVGEGEGLSAFTGMLPLPSHFLLKNEVFNRNFKKNMKMLETS